MTAMVVRHALRGQSVLFVVALGLAVEPVQHACD
jgi:hypothetical protein